jgi:hypothetical protein
MTENIGDDIYHREQTLMSNNQKIIFQKINKELSTQKWNIAVILWLKKKNEEKLHTYKKKIETLVANKAPATQIKWRQDTYGTLNKVQWKILNILQPIHNEHFDKIAGDPKIGWLGYNEALRESVWIDFMFGEREYDTSGEIGREFYRNDAIAKNRKAMKEHISEKKLNKKTEKVRLPQNHHLLHEDSYPKLKQTMWTQLDIIVNTYKQKFLKDIKDINQAKELIDHYFLFIFLQMLVQSKVVFDSKKPKSTPFFHQVICDCLLYIKDTYWVSPTISPDTIKKKFFNRGDETEKPLELVYKNCTEEDLIYREQYFNDFYFNAKEISVNIIRRNIMKKPKRNTEKMDTYWELLNPLYHLAKEKKEDFVKTLGHLEQYRGEHELIDDMIGQMQESIIQVEKDIKNNLVFEEDPPSPKNPDSLIKIQQQYLKNYKVPIQYRTMFGMVLNRLNNFYQVKNGLHKRAQKHNRDAFDKFVNSDQKILDMLYYINNLITNKQVALLFDQKWKKKQQDKIQRIQNFCTGVQKMSISDKTKKDIGNQCSLVF